MSAILLKQNLTNNRKRRKKSVDVEKGGESGEFDLEANGSCKPERGPSLLTAVGYRWLVVNKTLWERALRRRGCGINCEFGGIVRNHIFPDTLRYKYFYFSHPLSNRRLNFFTGSLLVRGVISANILFQILLWRTCMLLLFIKFHVSIIISVKNKLLFQTKIKEEQWWLRNHGNCVLLLLVDNLSLSESVRLHATQTTVPSLWSSSFKSLLLQ